MYTYQIKNTRIEQEEIIFFVDFIDDGKIESEALRFPLSIILEEVLAVINTKVAEYEQRKITMAENLAALQTQLSE